MKYFGDIRSKRNEQVAPRDGFGEALLELGKTNPSVIALTADLAESTRVQKFAEAYPERFIEMGVAEQNMAGVAAGAALAGKIPFMTSYAVFSPGRNWDQIRVSICYSKANVKIIGAHAGISVGPDGATHQALEDVAITRVLPNLVVVVPCDSIEARKATLAAAAHVGPVYLRFGREKTPLVTTDSTPFILGRAQVLTAGTDVTVIANGQMVAEALTAAEQLESEKIAVRVMNLHTVKPFDTAAVVTAAQETGAVVVAEEHQQIGGLFGAVAETLAQHHPVPIESVGVRDRFGESGSPHELMTHYGLTATEIITAIRRVLERKKNDC